MKRASRCFLFLFLLVVSAASGARGQSHDILSQAGFGSAVAVTKGDLLVGEPLNSSISGRVYVYRRRTSEGAWEKVQDLEPHNGKPENGFGARIASSGDLIAIGAHDGSRASIHVFRRNKSGKWIEEAELTSASHVLTDAADAAFAVAEDHIITTMSSTEVGARLVVFSRSGDHWTETGSIDLPTGVTSDDPRPVASSENLLFVGVPSETSGRVYVIDTVSEWRIAQTLKYEPGEDGESSLFGASLAAMDAHLFIGAPDQGEGRGAVHVYGRSSGEEFVELQTVRSFENTGTIQFGSVLSADSGSLVVGAYEKASDTGVAYVFEFDDTGRLVPSQVIRGETLEEDAEFATAIAAGDGVIAFGAMADLFGFGSVSVYEKSAVSDGLVLKSYLRPDLAYRQAAIVGDRVKCQDGKAGMYDCSNVDIMSFLPNDALGSEWGVGTNDVWGWTDPESGKEYAIVCTFDGTVFVDVSTPTQPLVVGRLPATPGTRPNWWRDAKTYKNFAYVVADNVGDHGLQIFDLTQLRGVEDPPVIFEPTARYGGFDSAHNIIINESTGFAYVVGINGGGNTCGGGSHILDLSDPVDPQFVGCFAHEGTGDEQRGYTHDAQCVVYHGPDERYTGKEICVAANETAISIADFSDKTHVIPISVGRYPNVSYAHQGWFTEDHRFFLQNDETDEINGLTVGTKTLVWDLAELDDPVLVDEHVSENLATDHNLYVKGNFMYQSNYVSGLRVYDVSNPVQMQEAAYFDTVPWGEDRPGYGGSWSNYPFFESGTIVVTSGEEGVFLLKRSEATP